jgi:uncharacterized protein (DUF2249 family)
MINILIETQLIPAQERHVYILKKFDSLETGDSITLINNHDPKPLLAQFDENRSSQFTSEYLLNGPIEWKVKLTKKIKAGCCGCC